MYKNYIVYNKNQLKNQDIYISRNVPIKMYLNI